MIKLIVSDLDGTLLPYGEDEISPKVKNLINEALGMGLRFAVSSGRTYGELLKFLPEFRDKIYFMCCDGACAYYSGKLLLSRQIEKEWLNLFERGAAKNVARIYHGDKGDYFYGDIPEEYSKTFNPAPLEKTGLPKNEKIFKITTFGEALKLPRDAALRIHWNGGETGKTVQYVNRFANKGTCLSLLREKLFLTGFETAVIGDAENDLPMMRGAKISYAVVSRSNALSNSATHSAPDAERALARIILGLKN